MGHQGPTPQLITKELSSKSTEPVFLTKQFALSQDMNHLGYLLKMYPLGTHPRVMVAERGICILNKAILDGSLENLISNVQSHGVTGPL